MTDAVLEYWRGKLIELRRVLADEDAHPHAVHHCLATLKTIAAQWPQDALENLIAREMQDFNENGRDANRSKR